MCLKICTIEMNCKVLFNINLHILKTINGIKKINKAFHSLNNIRFSDFSDLNSVKPEEFAFLHGMV